MKSKIPAIVLLIIIAGSNCFAKDIIVSAAASLKDVLQDIKKVYESEYKEEKIIFNFGGSGALQQQIENGAPADIFISAASKQIDELAKKGLIENETKTELVMNEVVLVIPKNSKIIIKDYYGLAGGNIKRIGIGEPASVPAGQYSMEIFKKLGLTEKVMPKLIYGKDVRAILTWVETENVDAGIVYKTDASLSDMVKIICPAPKESHSPVIYPAGITADSKSKDSAKKFLQYLKSVKAREFFEKYGFTALIK